MFRKLYLALQTRALAQVLCVGWEMSLLDTLNLQRPACAWPTDCNRDPLTNICKAANMLLPRRMEGTQNHSRRTHITGDIYLRKQVP